jgi:hypothetical protein
VTPSRLAFNVFKEGSWHILVTEHGSLEYSADSGGAVLKGQILWDMRYAHLLDLLASRSGFHSSLAFDKSFSREFLRLTVRFLAVIWTGMVRRSG